SSMVHPRRHVVQLCGALGLYRKLLVVHSRRRLSSGPRSAGPLLRKLAVSALIFDYLLTGPISGVSAGQYLVGLGLDSLKFINESWTVTDPATRELIKNWGAVVFAAGITIYFFRLNVVGIHESSDRALKIMFATTIMVVLMLAWCGATLAINGIAKNDAGQTNAVLVPPDLSPRPDTTDPITGK